jgi:hypothetical protein
MLRFGFLFLITSNLTQPFLEAYSRKYDGAIHEVSHALLAVDHHKPLAISVDQALPHAEIQQYPPINDAKTASLREHTYAVAPHACDPAR